MQANTRASISNAKSCRCVRAISHSATSFMSTKNSHTRCIRRTRAKRCCVKRHRSRWVTCRSSTIWKASWLTRSTAMLKKVARPSSSSSSKWTRSRTRRPRSRLTLRPAPPNVSEIGLARPTLSLFFNFIFVRPTDLPSLS